MSRLKKHFVAVAVFLGMVVACAGTVRAQGSRKDDIVFNTQGRPMAGATVRVCTSTATGQPCSPLALIYSDPGLTQALANPTSTDGTGNYSFYAAPGRYEIEISGPNITTKQLPNVILPSDPSSPTFATVTTTSGITAFSLSLSGNLTVTGSAAVTGSLSVGGAPVPSTGVENNWTASQHFKGPNPWRDFTAYMKDSNGNPVNCAQSNNAFPYSALGTISAGSNSLSISTASDFKNGCGLAIFGAGPTSTAATPMLSVSATAAVISWQGTWASGTTYSLNQGVTYSGANYVSLISSNIGNTPSTNPADWLPVPNSYTQFNVLVTTSSNDGLVTGYANGTGQGVVLSGCGNSAFNGTFPIETTNSTTLFQLNITGASGSTTGCAASFLFGYAHGITGSTTYKYQLVSIDTNRGYSAASNAITITNGNSALTINNYNWIGFPYPGSGVIATAIYSDKGLGGALTCVGVSFGLGYSDQGFSNPCPLFLPTNPPTTAGAQILNTTIASGGGTTALTLAAMASNAVTNASVYHDDSWALMNCVNDVVTGQLNTPVGNVRSAEFGCYIPPLGPWNFNGPLPTESVATNNQSLRIKVAGNVRLSTMPWIILQGGYTVEGVGGGGNQGSFNHESETRISVDTTVPDIFVIANTAFSTTLSGFSASNFYGNGVWVGQSNTSSGGPAGIRLNNMNLAEYGPAAGSSPVVLDSNVLGIYMDDDVLVGNTQAGGMPIIYFTSTPYNGNVICCVYINDLSGEFHGFRFDAPGGNGTGGGHNSIYVHNWLEENLVAQDLALIGHDYGPNAAGTNGLPLNGISLVNVNNADTGAPYEFVEYGTTASITSDQYDAPSSYLITCANGSTACQGKPPSVSTFSFNGPLRQGSSATGLNIAGNYVGSNTAAVVAGYPFMVLPALSLTGGTPKVRMWSMLMPSPANLSVTGTGSGSLSAATYGITVAGVDSLGNESDALPPVYYTLGGGSSSINLQWSEGQTNSMGSAYSGFTLYFCTGAGCTPNQKITGIGVNSNANNPVTYTFSSTSSAVSGSPNSNVLSASSWLYTEHGQNCFFCVGAHSDQWPIGIGALPPAPGSGINLSTAMGLRVGTQLQASETTAPSGVSGTDLIYADSTAHQWKKIENNGTNFNVAGTLSGTTSGIGGSALTAGQCASGTVSVTGAATTMTVSVSPNTYPGDGMIPWGYVSASGTVTVKVCAEASGTPTSSTYNVRVVQ